MSHHTQSNQNDTTHKDVITDNMHPGISVALDVIAPTAAAPLLPMHSEPVKPFDTLIWSHALPKKFPVLGGKVRCRNRIQWPLGHCSWILQYHRMVFTVHCG